MSLKYLFAAAFLVADALLLAGYYGLIPEGPVTLLAAAAGMALIASAGAWLVDLMDRRLNAFGHHVERLAVGVKGLAPGEAANWTGAASLGPSFAAASDAINRHLAELQVAAEQNRAMAEHGPDAMLVFDVEASRLVDVNENLVQLTGYRRDELIGMNPVDVSSPEQKGSTETYLRELVGRAQQGEKVIAPWTLRTKDGRHVHCELRAIRLPANGRTLICGSLMDVSERLRAEADLGQRMQLEALITRLSTGMISLTPERIDEGVHQALAEIGQFAGVDRSYVFQFDETGTRVSCTHEWCATGIAPQIQRLLNLPVTDYPWVIGRLRRGEVVHVPRFDQLPPEAQPERREWEMESIQSIVLVPMQTAGEVLGYVGFDAVRIQKTWSQDAIGLLTIFGEMVINALARKYAETALRQKTEALERANRELERSNIELQQFAYIASHDLQEPLRNIASFSSLLAKRYRGRLERDADEFIGYITDAAGRLSRMINDLLEYSRLDARARPFQPCRMDDVVAEALSNLSTSLGETGGQVTHGELPGVTGDPSLLVQLMQNLIGNAIKFHGDEPPRVRVEAQRENSAWHFTVRDNGIGMNPEEARQLFQLFKRLHAQDKYPGTGIGLAVCKRIVEHHRGSIWVEPNPDRGCTFHFTLPAKLASAAAA